MSHQKSRSDKNHSHSSNSHISRADHDNQMHTENSSRRNHSNSSTNNSDNNSINSSNSHADDGRNTISERSNRNSNHSKNNDNNSSKNNDNFNNYNTNRRDDNDDKRSHNDKSSSNNKSSSKSSRSSSKTSDHSSRHSESRSSKHNDKSNDIDTRNVENSHKRHGSHQTGETKTEEHKQRSHTDNSNSGDHKSDRNKSSKDCSDGTHSQKNLRSNHVSSNDKNRSKNSSDGNVKSGSSSSNKRSSSSHKTSDSSGRKNSQVIHSSSSTKNDSKTGTVTNNIEANSSIDTHKSSKENASDNSNDSNNNNRNDSTENSNKSSGSKSNNSSKSSSKAYNSADKYHYKSTMNSDISSLPPIPRISSKSASSVRSSVRSEKCDKDGLCKTIPSLYAMREKSLSCLKELFGDILDDSNDYDLCFRSFGRRTDVQKLDLKDYGLYGVSPSEPLPMILCAHCNHVMAPEGVARHINKCHDARSKILHPSNLVASKQMPSLILNKMKATYEKMVIADNATVNKFNSETSLQDAHGLITKDDEFINSSDLLFDSDSDMGDIKTKGLPIATSDLPHASTSTTSVSSSDSSDSSTNIATSLTSLAINDKIASPTFQKLLVIKDRDYDPNLHCGVMVEESKRCKEDLKCLLHSTELKKQVEGRLKPFVQLLKDYNDRPKIVQTQKLPSGKRQTASVERAIDNNYSSSSDIERRSSSGISNQSSKDSKTKRHHADKHQDELQSHKQKHDETNRHDTKNKTSKDHPKVVQKQDEQARKESGHKNQESEEERSEREKKERTVKRKEYQEKVRLRLKQNQKQKDDSGQQVQKKPKGKHEREKYESSLKQDEVSQHIIVGQDNEKERKKRHSSKKDQKDQKRSERQHKHIEEQHSKEGQEPHGLKETTDRKEEQMIDKSTKQTEQQKEDEQVKVEFKTSGNYDGYESSDDDDNTKGSISTTTSSCSVSTLESAVFGKQLSGESSDDFAQTLSFFGIDHTKSASYQRNHGSLNINVDSLHMNQFNELINDANGDGLDMSFWEKFDHFRYETDLLPSSYQPQENQGVKRLCDSMNEDIDYNAEQKRRRITESMLTNLASDLNGYDIVSLDTMSEHKDRYTNLRQDSSEIHSQNEKLKGRTDHSNNSIESKVESTPNSKTGISNLNSQERFNSLQSSDIIDITGGKGVTINTDIHKKSQANNLNQSSDDDDFPAFAQHKTKDLPLISEIQSDGSLVDTKSGGVDKREFTDSNLTTDLPLAKIKLKKDHILTIHKCTQSGTITAKDTEATANSLPNISSLPVNDNENCLMSIIQEYKMENRFRKAKLLTRIKANIAARNKAKSLTQQHSIAISSAPNKVKSTAQSKAISLTHSKPIPSVNQARRAALMIGGGSSMYGKENSLDYQNDAEGTYSSQQSNPKIIFNHTPSPVTGPSFNMSKSKGVGQFRRNMQCSKKNHEQLVQLWQSQLANVAVVNTAPATGNSSMSKNGAPRVGTPVPHATTANPTAQAICILNNKITIKGVTSLAIPYELQNRAPCSKQIPVRSPTPFVTNVKAPTSTNVKVPTSTNVKAPTSTNVKAPTSTNVKAPTSTNVKAPTSTNVKAPTSTNVKAPTSTNVKAPISTNVKAPTSTNVKALTSTNVKAPTSTNVKALTSTNVRALTSTNVRAPTSTNVRAPTSTHVKAPTSTHVKAPTSTHVKAPTSTNSKATTSNAMIQAQIAARHRPVTPLRPAITFSDLTFPLYPIMTRYNNRTIFKCSSVSRFAQTDKLLQKIPKALRKKVQNGAVIKTGLKRSKSPPKYKSKSLSSMSNSVKNIIKKIESPLSAPTLIKKPSKLNGETLNGEAISSHGIHIRHNSDQINSTSTQRHSHNNNNNNNNVTPVWESPVK